MDHCRIVEDINDSYRMAHENATTSRVRDILVQLLKTRDTVTLAPAIVLIRMMP